MFCIISNCVPTALRNASGMPGSNPFDFGPEVLMAAERVDHARSTAFCAQAVLCRRKTDVTQPLLAKISRSSPAPSAVP